MNRRDEGSTVDLKKEERGYLYGDWVSGQCLFVPWLSTITVIVGETVSREISQSRKSYFALMLHRKVDF